MTHTFTYKADGGTLFVEFDYQPEERQTWDEPGCSEQAEITSVLAGQIELLDLLSEETMEMLAEKALQSVASDREDAAYDRAEQRYQERRDNELMGAI